MKTITKYLFAAGMVTAGMCAAASSGVIELEIPGMNAETAAAIMDFRTNACPATVAAMRDSIATNYDGVVARKIAKRDELQAETDALIAQGASPRLISERQALVDEMTDIVDDMVEFKWYRVEQNVVRFADSRFGRKHDGDYRYNEPDADGFIPLLGASSDLCVAYTPVTNAAYALFDPSHAFAPDAAGQPVVNISFSNAVAYCEWLTENSPGYAYKYRLPTQEEWELAAGHMPKDASINAANIESGPTDVYYYYSIYTNGAQSLSGTLDMWGNVWEWLATPHTNGEMKVKGGAFDEPRSQCRTEERGNGRDPSQGYPNVGMRLLREKNWAAAVIQDANAARWLANNVDGGATLTAADYRELEADPDGDGVPTWAEYVALTNPNDPVSKFTTAIRMGADGAPDVFCTDGHVEKQVQSRTYRLWGKVELSDSVWIEVKDNAHLYRFFRYSVEAK